MTAPACGSCGAPVADARLCTGCTRDLAELLLLAASIAPDLDDAVARLLRRGSGGRASSEVPLPVDLNASAVQQNLFLTLVRCIGCLITEDEPAPGALDVTPMARWIAARLNRLRQRADAPKMLSDIRDAVHRALVVVDRKPERAPAGQCTWCGRQLLAELGADEVTCSCGQVKINLIADRMNRAAAADVLGTPAAVSDALKAIGINVPRGTITSWVSRKRLLPRPGGAVAMSEVLALHAQSTARVRG